MITKVVGVTYLNEDGSSRRDIIAGLSSMDKVRLEREPDNKYDPNAVRVCILVGDKWQQIGYLPKDVAAELAPEFDAGVKYIVRIFVAGLYNGNPYCELSIAPKIKNPYQKPLAYKSTRPRLTPQVTLRGHLRSVAPPPGRRYRGYRRRWEHDPNFNPRGGQGLLLIIALIFIILFNILPRILWGEPIF